MPIGKAREYLRGRKAKAPERDPDSVEAYEQGWYALLVRQAEEEGDDGSGGPPPSVPDQLQDPDEGGRPVKEVRLQVVTPLVVPSPEPARGHEEEAPRPEVERQEARAVREVEPEAARPAPEVERQEGRRDPGPKRARPARSEAARPPEPEPAAIRIGVRRLDTPEATYLRYLTSSAHRDFFRSDLWPISGSVTPIDLWRANHLGAAWEVDEVERFMKEAAPAADELVGSAPRSTRVGGPERRAWIGRFLSADWVAEFGVGRVSKTLHPMLPELVPDLDPAMMPWAASAWLGLADTANPDTPEAWLETCEVLEDVLVLRGQQLGQIVRRLRHVAPSLAPVGRFGPILAAFWESYWMEAGEPRRRSSARPRTSPTRSRTSPVRSRGATPTSTSDEEPETAAGGRSAEASASSGRATPTTRTTSTRSNSKRTRKTGATKAPTTYARTARAVPSPARRDPDPPTDTP
jgi:hypothetical protein